MAFSLIAYFDSEIEINLSRSCSIEYNKSNDFDSNGVCCPGILMVSLDYNG